MRKIIFTRKFERKLTSFVKFYPHHRERVRIRMKLIAQDPFRTSLKTHKLSGPLAGCLSSSIDREYRIVFAIKKDEITFLDIGSHDEVY